MCMFIGIESVAMNALIEIQEKKVKQEVTFDDVVRYGKKAARIFRRKTGDDTVLLLSKEYQASMMEDYRNYFEVEAYIERGVFRLRSEAPMEEIKEYFRWGLDGGLLEAFMSPEAVSELEG